MTILGIILVSVDTFVALVFGYGYYKDLRDSVPGSRPRGTVSNPRLCVHGRPQQSKQDQLRAPLTGRLCAAWKLRVVVSGEGLHPTSCYEYSSASFEISTSKGPVAILLDAGTSFLPSGNYTPPSWVIPDECEPGRFAVTVHYQVPVVPVVDGMSREQRDYAGARALEQIERFEIPESFRREAHVIETIVDFDDDWICEGPCWQLEPGNHRVGAPQPAIGRSASARTAVVSQLVPIKLAPVSELRKIKWKKAKQFLFPYLLLVTIIALPILIANL